MTNLELVTKKIKELVPEIMELKFGCWTKRREGRYMFTKGFYRGNRSYQYTFVGAHGNVETEQIVKFEESLSQGKYEILGRDIQLNDVLRAINEIFIPMWAVTNNGEFIVKPDDKWLQIQPAIIWDTSKPLHLQEKELHDFLHTIFYPNQP